MQRQPTSETSLLATVHPMRSAEDHLELAIDLSGVLSLALRMHENHTEALIASMIVVSDIANDLLISTRECLADQGGRDAP